MWLGGISESPWPTGVVHPSKCAEFYHKLFHKIFGVVDLRHIIFHISNLRETLKNSSCFWLAIVRCGNFQPLF